MNELVTLSDTELDKAIQDLKERELALKTDSGKRYITSKMRECIGWLESVGYKFEGDENSLARLWARSLEEEFVIVGESGIKKAVMEWASQDTSEYRSFPKVPWILESCKEIGGDPRVEKGRRIQAEAERQIELDHQREIEEIKKDPERWAEIQRKAEKLKAKYEQRPKDSITCHESK